ncbi:hypothetical protein HMPREF1145_1417 [Oribacterium parvum ACB8]|nr:hypothetical protein HMPREF1145_1417 [Oribacterium parvum ACB8]
MLLRKIFCFLAMDIVALPSLFTPLLAPLLPCFLPYFLPLSYSICSSV